MRPRGCCCEVACSTYPPECLHHPDGGGREGLRIEVSDYPTQVTAGDTFEVFVDVLNVDAPLESNVVPPEDITVEEAVGGSFVTLRVMVPAGAEPGVRAIVIELRSGERQATVNLGFTVEAP